MNSGKPQEMVRDREADKYETTHVKCLADPGFGGHQYMVFFVSGDFWLLFSRSVISDSLWPPGLQRTRLPFLHHLPVCSNSCPLSQWYHPTISSSVAPFSSCLQSFPALRSFPVSWLFASGGQSTGASASASVLPMNIQGWFPFGLTVWSPCSPRDSQESSPAPEFKSMSSSAVILLYDPTLTSIHAATAAAAAAKLLQSCLTLCNPIDGSPPGSPSLGFSRQEHWSGLPFPSPMHESEKWKWSCSVVSDS